VFNNSFSGANFRLDLMRVVNTLRTPIRAYDILSESVINNILVCP